MNPNQVITTAVINALESQPWWVRRKDTITAIAGGVLQLANVAVAYTGDLPEWASVLIAGVVMVCQALVHARTVGAITPSMAARLSEAGGETGERPPRFTVLGGGSYAD